MISRLGVYGGMFDPVHQGHMAAACYARDLLNLDLVKFIPCKLPNHRQCAQASADHRVAMLELALADLPNLEIDLCELNRSGVSYAVDTLEYLRDAEVAEHIVFIMGIDSFNSLASWHRWEALESLCHLLVLPREGGRLDDQIAQRVNVENRLVSQPASLFAKSSGNIYLDADFAHQASSTQVRHALGRAESGRELMNLLNTDVFQYIQANNLYGISEGH